MRSLTILALLSLTGITMQCQHHAKAKKIVSKNSGYNVIFNKTAPVNDSSDVGINWKVERPISEFVPEAKNRLAYRFELLNDSIAALSQKVNGTWQEQDKFRFEPWRWIITDTGVTSQFEIKDFDRDGDQDLVCFTESNINGNEWTLLYINNGSKLIKLYNTADESYFWFAPEFDKKKNIIKTNYFGSAYGHDDENKYKLNGTTAIPLTSYHQERSSENITDSYYIGENGKWKLIRTETEKIPQ